MAITGFGEGLDKLARERGGWPDNAAVYGVEVMEGSRPDAPDTEKFVRVTGDVPTGADAKGWPKWPKGKAAKERVAIITLAEYRAALIASTQEKSS